MTDRPRATAGVLLTRDTGTLEVALVHRPRYDDWTWPKGGVERGEHLIQAAVREAAEETGLAVRLGRRLPSTRYARPGGTTHVTWWSAAVAGGGEGGGGGGERGGGEGGGGEGGGGGGGGREGGGGEGGGGGGEHGDGEHGDDEVDELRWVTPEEAAETLSYPSDRDPLRDLLKRPPLTGTVILVRHASAGERRLWKGADAKRPLDAGGRARAFRLGSILPAFGPARLIAATPVRCRETIEPLGEVLGAAVELDRRWDDTAWQRGPRQVLRALAEISTLSETTVVCSQGETIPGAVALLAQQGGKQARSDVRKASNGSGSHRLPRSRKGSFWVLSFNGATLIAADYIAD